MLKEVIETGRTVDEAIESACLKLGIQREDCEWEIVDLPKKTFFGLKSIPAKVRVSIELPDSKPERKPAPKAAPPRQEAPRREERPEPQPQKAEAPKAKPEEKPAPAPRQEQPRREREQPVKEWDPQELAAKMSAAEGYVQGILTAMGLEATATAVQEEGGLCIRIEGKGLGVMIGRRGETLDAVQYLTGLVVNRLEGGYIRVTIDCGDYRVKRQKTLESLAKRLAAQVLKTNVSKTLEPMNPFERRIIHSIVSEIEGVSSTSIGEEPNRRVVISTPTSRKPAPRSDDRRGSRDRDRRDGGRDRDRGGRDRDRRGGGRPRSDSPRPPRAPQPSAPETPKATPEATTDESPLYAKIDLE